MPIIFSSNNELNVIAVPTGYPVGGWYALDAHTGLNLGWSEDGVTPKHFKDPQSAIHFGDSSNKVDWSDLQFLAAVSLVCRENRAARVDGCPNEYLLNTPAGALHISATNGNINCLFIDIPLAAELIAPGRLSVTTGSWDFFLQHSRRHTARAFATDLSRLMSKQTSESTFR